MTGAVLGQESGSAKKRAVPGRNGGESASGGAKGDGGESALELGVVVVTFFLGGEG